MWEVEFTQAFGDWWQALDADEQESLHASIEMLRRFGPRLGRPHVDSVKNSKHSNMKELRTQHRGEPIRTLFAFDPRRRAILLIGGNKAGDARFYKKMIPQADRLYSEHLAELKRRGLI